jgi:hypothetical protein
MPEIWIVIREYQIPDHRLNHLVVARYFTSQEAAEKEAAACNSFMGTNSAEVRQLECGDELDPLYAAR